jgi:hypothetical protein
MRNGTIFSVGVTALVAICALRGQASVKPELATKALQAMRGAEEIVFVVRPVYEDGHYYANFGYWSGDPKKMLHPPDGTRLGVFNLRTRSARTVFQDRKGNIRDPRVSYDGTTLLFAYRKGGTPTYHLYEMRTDGTGLKQLTFGDWDDVDPAYLPDGGIVFVSTRCKRFVPCYHTQTALLYRMAADGSDMRLLSANNVDDNRPSIMPDGRILYTRWEYVDRAPQKFHSLWTMNPDGTDQLLLYGNTESPPELFTGFNDTLIIDAMAVPGSGKIVSVFSRHGIRESAGNVMRIDPKKGPDDWRDAKQISPNVKIGENWTPQSGFGGFRDPYPVSSDCFLVARDSSLYLLGLDGATQEVYRAETMLHDPRVIWSQPRERLVPPRCDPESNVGQLVLANVYRGRNMEGVKPGSIKKLLVLEDLPKPVSYYSLPGALGMDGTHTLHRILGTVPVEADGSAAFEIPPLRGLFFVALDENGVAVKRMQSYTMAMPGETQGCVGCHEPRSQTISPNNGRDKLIALTHAPSKIEPIRNVPEIPDYSRDIQPIWNRHCVSCHSVEKASGHVVLTRDRNEWFTQSYYALFAHKQISDSWRYDENGNHAPYDFGTGASLLMRKIDGSHHDVLLSRNERDCVRLWIETGATFMGTYAVYNSSASAVAGALCNTPEVKIGKPLDKIVQKRCFTCHGSAEDLGKRHTKGRVNLPKHCWNLYNLSYPEKSMILLAGMLKEAGGYGWCKGKDGNPVAVFKDTSDPDYQIILKAIRAAKNRQENDKSCRPDLPGFRPNENYVRWLKRFGVLPESFDVAKDPINVYEADEAYWRSLWYHPSMCGVTKCE